MMASIDGSEYKELFQLFATRGEFAQIQQMLGAISVKLDGIVPRDTHDHIWKADAEWKNHARLEINTIGKDIDVIKNLIGEVKEGNVQWAQGIKEDVEALKTGESSWQKQVKEDMEDFRNEMEEIKKQRVPQWFFIVLGWIVPGIVMFALMHMH